MTVVCHRAQHAGEAFPDMYGRRDAEKLIVLFARGMPARFTHGPRFTDHYPSMRTSLLDVLYEDNHLLAVSKPCGVVTMGLRDGKSTLLTQAKDYIKRKYAKPGNVYLGIVSRLDAPVTGIVLLARTSKAARRLSEQFRERRVKKTYLAIVEGQLKPRRDELVDWLRKDERHRRMHVSPPEEPADDAPSDAKLARLRYQRKKRVGDDSLLEVQLLTGRKHQIRVQLASRGHPILGDVKYGSRRKFPNGIALHAWRLIVEHPVRHEPLEIVAPIPAYWPEVGP